MMLFIKCLTKLAEQQCDAIGDGYRRLYRQTYHTLFNATDVFSKLAEQQCDAIGDGY